MKKKNFVLSAIVLVTFLLVGSTNGFETYDYMTRFSGWNLHLGELSPGVIGSGFLDNTDFSMRYTYTNTSGYMLAIAELQLSRMNAYQICFDAWGKNNRDHSFRYLQEICIDY